MSMFPEECKKAFVWDGRVGAWEVTSMMLPVPSTSDMWPSQKKMWKFFVKFTEKAEGGMLMVYIAYQSPRQSVPFYVTAKVQCFDVAHLIRILLWPMT